VILVKLFLVPCFIALVAVSGRVWGAGVAGLLSGLPIIAAPIVWFIYLEKGLDFAQATAAATVNGIIALSTFCFSYAWFCGRYAWPLALAYSGAIYLVVAMLVGQLELPLVASLALTLSVLLLQIYFSPKQDNQRLLAPASLSEILCRMLFAFLLVLGVTQFSGWLGPTYSGIFAAFPIAGSTIALFSHRNYSAAHAVKSLKSMKRGLISMLVFFYILAVAANSVGFSTALFVAISVAVLVQLGIGYFVKTQSVKES
jgi:uncharacterized membrane protein (GlpM family)